MPVASVLLLAAVGAVAGAGLRLLLTRLRRGVVLRPGPAEAAAAVLFAATALAVPDGVPLALGLWAALLTVALSATDLVHHRLPDAITYPAVGITAALVGVLWWIEPSAGSPLRAAAAAAVAAVAFFALGTIPGGAMGLGDAKLSPTLGGILGFLSWPAVGLGVCLAFLFAGVVTGIGLLTRRIGLRSRIAFGPYLLTGTWVAVLLTAGALRV